MHSTILFHPSAKLKYMKQVATIMLGLAAVFLLESCIRSKKNGGNSKTTDPAIQLNGSWELHYISGQRIAFDGLYPRKKPVLIFKLPAAEVSGNSSCNGFSAPVKMEGSKISFGDGIQTMMACEGNGEQVFFSTLKKISSYSVNQDTLTLFTGDIAMMRFTKK